MTRSRFGLWLGLAAMLALAACARPTQEEILASGWSVPPPSLAGVVYCYRTLAAPDCRREPEPGQEDRLISYNGNDYGSPPR